VHEVTHDWLADYIQRRLDKTDEKNGCASGHTVQKELITIRKALKLCVKRGILPQMPSFPEFSPAYKPRETWLTPEQFSLVCAELAADRRLWAALAALAGANLSEVEAIEWTMVDLARGRMLIPGTKRETRRRHVPIAPALRHLLEQVPVEKRRGRVVQRWGNVRRDLHAAVERANVVIMTRALEAKEETWVEIPKVSPNDLRRTFASWLIQNGADRFTVANLMGHTSTRMIEKVYGKLKQENLDMAIAVLPQLPGWTE
jgi:integrase